MGSKEAQADPALDSDADPHDDGGAVARLVDGGTQTGAAPAVAASVASIGYGLKETSFHSQYSEVLLLLDNISATKGKELPPTLDAPIFRKADGSGPDDWIQQIAAIYDPPSGTEEVKSIQTAKIYRARDALNAAAAPATGETIAFTLMVVGERGWGRGSRAKVGRPDYAKSKHAEEAFPNLVTPASRFRHFLNWLFWFLLGWLALTSVLSWYVATGNALLEQYSKVELAKKAIQDKIDALGLPDPNTGGQTAPGTPPSDATVPAARLDVLTRDMDLAKLDEQAAKQNLRDWLWYACWSNEGCLSGKASLETAGGNASQVRPAAPQAGKPEAGKTPAAAASGVPQVAVAQAAPVPKQQEAESSQVNWQWAGILLAVLANNILPVFYGLLGAGAAVARRLSQLMRDYLLTPRDLKLSFIQLTLGALMGATIGIFIAPTNDVQASSQGLLANIRLSTSAICFVAGFGVEGLFQALESLVRRLFGLETGNGK